MDDPTDDAPEEPGGYLSMDHEREISAQELSEADRETQIDVMRDWFHSKYEDPAHNTPFEGEYTYIWGGPYDAQEELTAEFEDVVPQDVIDGLAEELSRESVVWSGKPGADTLDDYLLETIVTTGHYASFLAAVGTIERLLEVELDPDLEIQHFRLLFVNVITAMETYLSDLFIREVTRDETVLRKFVETNPEYQKEKAPISDIYRLMEGIKQKVQDHLTGITWHNVERVMPMYKATLGIELPSDLSKLLRAVALRHDIVHRNGKSKDGKEKVVDKDTVRHLILEVNSLVESIENQMRERGSYSTIEA